MPGLAIQMRQISKKYAGQAANSKIDFELKKGTIHAIAGENGAGKSTLMKILFGLVQPDKDGQGEIYIDGKKADLHSPQDAIALGIGMVQQHFALSGVITPLENIILGAEPGKLGIIDRVDAQKTLTTLAREDLAVPWNEPTESLAIGLQQRIEILKLLFRNADVLILDEPTGVLTPQEVEAFFGLLRRLRDYGKSIIIITHKIDEMMGLCDEVTVLRGGKKTAHFNMNELTKDKLIEAMIGRKLKSELIVKTEIKKDASPVIEVKNLTTLKRSRGSIKNICFKIQPGEILGVAGVEGNGQQALVETLIGMDKYSGEIIFKSKKIDALHTNVRKKMNFGLISEDRHHQSLWLDETIESNCLLGLTDRFSRFGFIQKNLVKDFSKKILSTYDVRMQSFSQPVSALSGGNQQKVVIAREVKGRKPEFLIASQPTRGVDVGAIELIHESIIDLAAGGSAILLISSELEEICKLSHRVIVLCEGGISGEFTSPYNFQTLGQAMTSKRRA